MRRIFLFIFCVACSVALSAQRQVAPTKGPNMNKNFERSEGQYADMSGVKIYVEQYGDETNTPMLILHNNGDSIPTVSQQIQFFAKRFRVIAVDLRGHGRSSIAGDSLTYEQMATDMFNLLNQLEMDSICVLGFGDGAVVGLLLAMEHPEKVKKLIVMSARLSTNANSVTEAKLEEVKKQIGADMDSIKDGKTEFKADLMRRRLWLYQPQIDPEDLQLIEAPVLVMSGDHDIILLNHTIAIFESLTNAELCILPGTTEMAAIESSQFFNNQSMRFLLKKD